MWTQLFFLYNIITLIIASSISAKLKDISEVNNVVYLNNIIIALSVSMVSVVVGLEVGHSFGCSSANRVDFNLYSSIILIIITLIMEAMFIALVSSSQYKNCPADVKNLSVLALTLNSIGILAGGAFIAYPMIQKENERY